MLGPAFAMDRTPVRQAEVSCVTQEAPHLRGCLGEQVAHTPSRTCEPADPGSREPVLTQSPELVYLNCQLALNGDARVERAQGSQWGS